MQQSENRPTNPSYSVELIQNIIKAVREEHMSLEDAAETMFVLFGAVPAVEVQKC